MVHENTKVCVLGCVEPILSLRVGSVHASASFHTMPKRFMPLPPLLFRAEYQVKDGGDAPAEVSVVPAGFCFLLGGDGSLLCHEHTSGKTDH